ncbi:PRC-barrel domain-containing protein [Thalassococcus sp. BH17M4-6]|uniref:PRC-barrel domain-containing protein n=1 Tax=Thalassococcus sp. BH17M4-6 TaxID=3413148 RepID=UPI003BEC16BB
MKHLFTTTALALTLAAGAAYAESHTNGEEMEQNLENAGESLENAGENAADATGEAMNDAGEAVENAAEDTAQATENAAEETGEAVDNAANETGEAVENAADETGEAMDNAADETAAAADAAAENANDMASNDTNMIRVRDILGGEIYSADTQNGVAEFSTQSYSEMGENWENIGEIEDIILTSDGKIKGIVAEVGGFLGIGDKHVMLEMQNVQLVPVEDESYKVVVGYSEEELENMQSVDESPLN